MHTIRTLPTSPPARRTTAVLLALLLALSMIPLAAFAGTSEETYDLPAPPSNVQASADQDLIRISWDPVDGQAIYALYRSETGTDPWQTVNVTSSTSWADTRAEPGKT